METGPSANFIEVSCLVWSGDLNTFEAGLVICEKSSTRKKIEKIHSFRSGSYQIKLASSIQTWTLMTILF